MRSDGRVMRTARRSFFFNATEAVCGTLNELVRRHTIHAQAWLRTKPRHTPPNSTNDILYESIKDANNSTNQDTGHP